jgi:hypothetical protein
MFLCIPICLFACACLSSLSVAIRMRFVPELQWIDDQALVNMKSSSWRIHGWRPWAYVWWRQVSSDTLYPIYFIIHCPAYHDQPKDGLVFCFPVLVYPLGIGYFDYYYVIALQSLNMMRTFMIRWCYLDYDYELVILKEAREVSRVLLRKDLFVGWPPEKIVQPWGWNRTPLAN